ncbi:MMPL family transporter [Flavobacterium psychrophilum]|uniref:efflux RND transporter permease subunit n=1 Tax=Flavobacterium psychrophilum TaxID=96345 RepID=UPI000B7C4A60|nr:MMPL family transporter [Flavobacterium psychrophilum]ELI6454952.1 MMPL family transporter [Flavobacterium psychrophilum]ELY2016781.1 MMPL family transporter [Flavobacterium psychrophilum]MCB6062503.1 MMPL family transporter [Flavobacterium psychrophilum]MCB6098301.1 MMPL family transporter [Flavobacterium psychrophilum]SNB12305.1 putative efflux transporter, RND superfamily [Flavobacterium psychrophilum]
MKKMLNIGFWAFVARVILRNRIVFLSGIVLITILFSMQWKNIKFTQTEANLIPFDDQINVDYRSFLKNFGEEGNLVVIATKDPKLFTPKVYKAWNNLMATIQSHKEVDLVISISNLKKLVKNDSLEKFELRPLIDTNKTQNQAYLSQIKSDLLNKLPFYEGLLFNKKSGAIRSAIYLDKKIINTKARKDFVLNQLIPEIESFEKETGVDLRTSGMPYIRTLNAKTILDEIGLFIGAALLITGLIFFFFFRSFRATLISLVIVIIGVMWSFGLLGLLGYEITVLTALVPTLVIVIGIPNCIFLINKYHQEYQVHGNKAKSLQRVITKTGTATLMTNLTTALGFATFIVTNNVLLTEFGVVTSINIIALYLLCLFIIPIFFSYIPAPIPRHLGHLEREYLTSFMGWILRTVKYNRIGVYITSILLLVLGIIGIYEIRISGSIIEDMPKRTAFFDDIRFFEKEFDGVMPLEIMIDTKRKKGVMKLSMLKRMEELEETIQEIPELAKPLSIVNLVKYSKQAYYNGNPEYYELPTQQEQAFILSYAKKATQNSKENLMKSYVDSTGQFARITTFIKDENGEKMSAIEAQIRAKANKLFPSPQYNVIITGKALVFQKGTQYLLDNLLSSLAFAFLITSLLVLIMFRSVKMVIVSLIPNLLPLILTAGLMGFLGIPLKPSTILVFGIAYGLSVDDTLRFLAQYRLELARNDWKIKKSVIATFNDAGISMFYTSIVLFFGFSVFMLSSFGGTVALGGLVAITLFFGMLSNLVLLPALVLSLNKTLSNEQEFIEPTIDILERTDAEVDAMENKNKN